LEIEHARHVYARFVKNNMEMKMALEQEQDEDKKGHAHVRSKRNIFGSIISSLTGLATGACPLHQHKTYTILTNFTQIDNNGKWGLVLMGGTCGVSY
jgi:hypothetical protein